VPGVGLYDDDDDEDDDAMLGVLCVRINVPPLGVAGAPMMPRPIFDRRVMVSSELDRVSGVGARVGGVGGVGGAMVAERVKMGRVVSLRGRVSFSSSLCDVDRVRLIGGIIQTRY
jgi:hypothetical protein